MPKGDAYIKRLHAECSHPGRFEATTPDIVHLYDTYVMNGFQQETHYGPDFVIDVVNLSDGDICPIEERLGIEPRPYYIATTDQGFVVEIPANVALAEATP